MRRPGSQWPCLDTVLLACEAKTSPPQQLIFKTGWALGLHPAGSGTPRGGCGGAVLVVLGKPTIPRAASDRVLKRALAFTSTLQVREAGAWLGGQCSVLGAGS